MNIKENIMSNHDCMPSVTIKGIITAMKWDKDDNVIAICLSTSDEEEYLVEENPFTDGLLNLLYEPVRVTGFINIKEDGSKSIFVKSYELLDEDEFLQENRV
jgi:hypothetical protein